MLNYFKNLKYFAFFKTTNQYVFAVKHCYTDTWFTLETQSSSQSTQDATDTDVKSELKEETVEKSQETESMQSSVVMSDSADPKLEVSSEEGSYDVIKHKGLYFH